MSWPLKPSEVGKSVPSMRTTLFLLSSRVLLLADCDRIRRGRSQWDCCWVGVCFPKSVPIACLWLNLLLMNYLWITYGNKGWISNKPVSSFPFSLPPLSSLFTLFLFKVQIFFHLFLKNKLSKSSSTEVKSQSGPWLNFFLIGLSVLAG